MIKRILAVGGFTLLSRLTGFVRDVILAAILPVRRLGNDCPKRRCEYRPAPVSTAS